MPPETYSPVRWGGGSFSGPGWMTPTSSVCFRRLRLWWSEKGMHWPRSGRARRGLAIALGALVLLAWLAYAAVFVYRVEWGGGRVVTPEVRKLTGQEPQDEWLALFQHGRKVGYSHTRLIPRDDGFDASEELFLRLLFLEETQEVFSTLQAQLAP